MKKFTFTIDQIPENINKILLLDELRAVDPKAEYSWNAEKGVVLYVDDHITKSDIKAIVDAHQPIETDEETATRLAEKAEQQRLKKYLARLLDDSQVVDRLKEALGLV